jgi:Pyruvate/2-oxoacid:ferredoxin oxidoreductase gamma subunit
MPDDITHQLKNYKTITLNAVDIAIKSDLRVGGIPVVTIPLLGALLKVLKIVDIKTATDVIRSRWEPDVANKNIKALEEAMGVVRIE